MTVTTTGTGNLCANQGALYTAFIAGVPKLAELGDTLITNKAAFRK
jgi:hypothetical protein